MKDRDSLILEKAYISILENTITLHRVEQNPENPLATPREGRISNARSLFGFFFTEEPPTKDNISSGSRHDTYTGTDLRLFDWDAYGSGSWDKFNDRVNKYAVENVKDTKKLLLSKGYDGIVVFERGYGKTVVVFPESVSKIIRFSD